MLLNIFKNKFKQEEETMKVEEASRILKELALQRKINLIDIFNS